MKRLIRIFDRLSLAGGWLSGLMICLGLSLVVAEILTRSMFDSTLYIAEEYAGYMMCGLTFCALAYTLREKGHIRMTFLQKVVKGRPRLILDLVCFAVGVVFSLGLTYNTSLFFWDSVVTQSQSMQISETYIAIPQFALPLGALLLTLQFISEFLKTTLVLKDDTEGLNIISEAEDLGR